MFSRKQMTFYSRRLLRLWEQSVGGIFKGIARIFLGAFFFLWAKARTRDWFLFVQGLPALLAFAGVVVLSLLRMALPAEALEGRYVDQAEAAKERDNKLAMLCYERLASFGQQRPKHAYELALCYDAEGDSERAFKIMSQLASVNHTIYGPAHHWLARYYSRNLGNPKNFALAEAHLQQALSDTTADLQTTRVMLGNLFYFQQQMEATEKDKVRAAENAVKHLAQVVDDRPGLRLRYAEMLASLKRQDKAREQAKRAIAHYQHLAESNIRDSGSRISWAMAESFLEEFATARKILEKGFSLTDDKIYRSALAHTCLREHMLVATKFPDDVDRQLALLQDGFNWDTTNSLLLSRLSAYISNDKERAAKVRSAIQKAHAAKASALTHFLLGADAFERGDKDDAQLHWEQAAKLAPNVPVLANNLASLIAGSARPDLPHALNLVNQAINAAPGALAYRDTRGKIYMKLANASAAQDNPWGDVLADHYWREALVDLQLVQSNLRNFPGIHSSLAEVYDRLGQSAIAAEHRRQADQAEHDRKKGG